MTKKSKRFNLVLPEELLMQVQRIAEEEHTTVVEIFRRFIKLGLLAVELQKKPNSALILKQGGEEREVLFL